jgi:cytochrome P450
MSDIRTSMPATEAARKVPAIGKPLGDKTAPGPHGNVLLGSALALQHDPLSFFTEQAERYGDVVRTRLLFWPSYLIFHPDGVKHVLQGNHQNYDRNLFLYKAPQAFLGKGLATTDGTSWLQHRRLMQPAFHRTRIAAFGSLMTEATTALLARWQNVAECGQSLDMAEEMMRLTLRIIGQALFSVDLDDESDTVGQAFSTVLTLLGSYLYLPFPPLSVPTPRNQRMKAGIQTLDAVVERMITQRRRRQVERADLLSMLLEAQDEETGQGMSDQQVRDEVLTLLFAGHETTANALTWAWYLLSQHPDVECRLHAELDEVLQKQVPTIEHLARLPYTRMVIEETLRLYPPGAMLMRRAIAADSIGDYRIPAKSIVFLSPYVTHRHPDFWNEPEVFNPERFTSERVATRHRYAYFPFGGGPHLCIGNHFAMMEAQLVLATIAQRYRVHLVPGQRVEPQVVTTIRPRYGLQMTLQRREQTASRAIYSSV